MHPNWQVFSELCKENGVRPTRVLTELGIPVGIATNWKNGISYPKHDKVMKIAEYFGKESDEFYVV